MKKLIFLAGLGIGFVVGARSGRETYDKLEAQARQFAQDPRVQEQADKARAAAQDAAATVKERAPEVAAAAKEKASSAAATAKEKASSATHRADADTAPDADTDSRDSAAIGGDAEVGDRPLES
ncbi:hypothetical protein [Brachybacterium nesterenkovii]|uniref:hypothetical protein n=1 Tax=Brachybacterium nesterenkovii TaxID=47847 RepID=UPI003219FFBF